MFDWLPRSVSTYGNDMDSLLSLIFWIIGVWFVLAEAILIAFVVAYRRKPGRRAAYVPGRSLRQLSWVLVPALLILGFDLAIDAAGAPVWHRIKETIPEADLTVRVTGKQFAWDFVHPGKDGVLDTGDDVRSEFELVVPSDRVVVFELQSADVVHSFWLPHLRLKQDAVPGRTIRGWFEVTEPGVYPIACAELCGLGHTKMRGQLTVLDPDEHRSWVESQEVYEEFWDE